MITDKPTVLLDVDGVLANFIAGALANMKRLFNINGSYDQVTNWNFETCFNLTADQAAQLRDSWREPGYCAELPPYAGVISAVAQLRDYANVYPLTAPFLSVSWVSERDAWLERHFGFPRKQITHTEAKYLVKGDVFVDDKPEHVVAWQAAHPIGVGILWAQPYNVGSSAGRIRTGDWSEVIAVVKVLALLKRHPRDHHDA